MCDVAGDNTVDPKEGVHLEVDVQGMLGTLACRINALEKKLEKRSHEEALSVVASAINSFTDHVFLIPQQVDHKSKSARDACFDLLEAGDHAARARATKLLSESKVGISVDDFLRLRREICAPSNRPKHDIVDAADFAEALEILPLDPTAKALLTRLHTFELEADAICM